ncbi:GNAT family N-acetyltransferase [Hahella sp. SMD15-11]|uniref:GNAT family N-acetyltransferase n=1 Tax=Thermohahella caldifontis TaxID=3142973 RepID=A0AB39V1M5_9GAMM
MLVCYLLLMVLAMSGYRFCVARKVHERRVVFKMRWQVYRHAGYINETTHPERVLRDAYESHSMSFLAYYKGKPAGTLRLTRLDKGSPIQSLFNINVSLPHEKTAELGRFAVLPEFRTQGRWVTMGLTIMMYLASLRQDVRWWVGYTPEGLLRSFSQVFDARAIPQLQPEPRHLSARKSMPGYFQRFDNCIVCFMAPVSSANPTGWLKRLILIPSEQIREIVLKCVRSILRAGPSAPDPGK